MKINIEAEKSVFSFGVVKTLLTILKFSPQTKHEYLAYKMLYPLSADIKHLSLTDSQNPNEQLRFFVKERIIRALTKLCYGIKDHLSGLDLHIYNTGELDEGSRLFLETVGSRLRFLKITFHLSKMTSGCKTYELNDHEAKLQQLIYRKQELSMDDRRILHKEALIYIGVGDPWTAENILKRLIDEVKDPDYYYRLGIIYTQLGRTIEADYYLEKCRAAGSESDRALANYVLAMLYVRHHTPSLLNPQKSRELLEEAYTILTSLNEDDMEDLKFHRIFNRNGYALILFREGRIDEAVELLETGIRNLTSQKTLLHKTVLMYNLAQCFTRMGQYQKAVDLYQQVMDSDPFYPENYLECARVFIFTDDYMNGLEFINKAIDLDPFIPEAYSLAGYCYGEISELDHSLESYKKAWELDTTSVSSAYDYAYILSEQELYKQCFEILESVNVDISETSEEALSNFMILRAEAALNCYGKEQALAVLQEGLKYLPQSTQISDNIEFLQRKKVEV